ncbi:MAG: hypothetical protein J2P36_04985 [Ktedonobacteraceae bacterium]|nr:hypothetical protein [Ktedonobacteraceae bacterium]
MQDQNLDWGAIIDHNNSLHNAYKQLGSDATPEALAERCGVDLEEAREWITHEEQEAIQERKMRWR